MSTQTTCDFKPIVKRALALVGEIATLPEVTTKVMDVVEDPDGTAADLHDVIKCDPALSTKVLSVVNSAFYGLPGQVASLERAIVLLGSAAVKNIAVAASLARMFKAGRMRGRPDARTLWIHSVAVGVAAKAINAVAGKHVPPDEAFLAGLIHDLGLLAERQAFPDKLAEVMRRYELGGVDFVTLEQEVIGATHEELGEALTRNWKFPDRLRAAIGAHHHPESLPKDMRSMASIIYCADTLCCREGFGLGIPAGNEPIATETLEAVGVTEEQLATVGESLEAELAEAESVLGATH